MRSSHSGIPASSDTSRITGDPVYPPPDPAKPQAGESEQYASAAEQEGTGFGNCSGRDIFAPEFGGSAAANVGDEQNCVVNAGEGVSVGAGDSE